MKIFSITIVQNQEDIIEENIRHHQPLFDDIYIWDIGSIDNTSDILDTLALEFSNIHLKKEKRTFSNDLRGEYYNDIKNRYSENDWYYQLDSDEFLQSDLKYLISKISNSKVGYFRTWHYNFKFTDIDKVQNSQSYKQLNYYLMDYSEIRAFKNSPHLSWPLNDYSILPLGNILPINLTKLFKAHHKHITIYHYPLRSYAQIQKRIREKLKIINGPNYKETEGINYRKYKTSSPDQLIINHLKTSDIRLKKKISFKNKVIVRYITEWKPLFNFIMTKFKQTLK